MPRVRLMGSPQMRMHGNLAGRRALATPDIGADLSLVSAKHARLNNWKVDRSLSSRIKLRFADGSVVDFGRKACTIRKINGR